MTFHAPRIETEFNPLAYALACWLKTEGADFNDPEDCRRVIYRAAPRLCRFGITVTEAEPLVIEAAALARANPESIQ